MSGSSEFGVRSISFTRSVATYTYLSGSLTIFDSYSLIIPIHIDHYDTISLQPGSNIAYVGLIAASLREVLRLLALLRKREFSSQGYNSG